MESDAHELGTLTAVREIVGEPQQPAAPQKLLDALDDMSRKRR